MADVYVLKEYYIRYLRNIRKLSEVSIKHYINAIRTVSKYLVKRGSIQSSLYEITDLDALEKIKKQLSIDVEYLELDARGHRMYSAGFNNYYRFAQGNEFAEAGTSIRTLDFKVDIPDKNIIVQNAWQRNPIIKRQSIESANYLCEYDKSHKTFTAKGTNKPYMEGHHAIPMKEQVYFHQSLDVYANVVCLCPICHRLLHYGTVKEKAPVLNRIYQDRSERLANSGIILSRNEFISFVNK